MSPFDKLFQAQVDKLLSANNKRRAFFFRGFLPKQIEFLIRHKTSLYMNEGDPRWKEVYYLSGSRVVAGFWPSANCW